MLPGIIFMALSAMLFIFAYLLYFKEAYWLISGINFTPRETVRERYDLSGLTKHLARMCAIIGTVLLISGVGAFLGREMLFAAPIFSLFIILPVFLFGTERYMYVGRKTQRIINIAVTALLAVVSVFVISTTVTGAKPAIITIDEGSVMIESMYGTEISLDSIESVDMFDLTGRDISKLNGFNMGDNLKGKFDVEGIGTTTLYQQGKPCNSVLIRAGDRKYLINLGSEAENENLKSKIIKAVNKNI
jgi:hypothetical protein